MNEAYPCVIQAYPLLGSYKVQAWQQYWNKITHNSTQEPPARRREKPHIVDDALDDDDWHTLIIYLEVLKPFEEATTRMQGNPSTASGSRVWDMLPTRDVRQLWEAEYKHRVILIQPERPPERRRIVVASGLNDFLDNLTCPAAQLEEDRDEYDHYLARTDDPEDLACTDPITYWISKRSPYGTPDAGAPREAGRQYNWSVFVPCGLVQAGGDRFVKVVPSRSAATSVTRSTKSTRRSASPVKPGTLKDLQKPVEPRYFSQDEHWAQDGGTRELEDLLEIRNDALLCRSSNASEAAWNSDVHSPLLKLALKPFKRPLIRRHVLTSTPINPEFVPPMRECSFYDKVGSKMVDYGIALHPDENSALGQAIRRALQQLLTSMNYLNHVAYDPIKYAANAVSIETKAGSKGPQEARSQLGIWISSWSFRMHQLLDGRKIPADVGEAGESRTLIPVPVIIVIEHVWTLSFACDRGHRIDIIGDVPIGNTKSLDGLLILIAVIRRLACWIQGDFQSWLQEALLSS
ncbi:hypothetical protein DER46DRAFT_578682 [Fusarium sp. MPI-SDFR-AT-0072]|nr:hypothetical protein DER46DRAFT_578682 [Fusarium sp. MPI-SDFR-AT-0072]